jgi:pimeloyl-ACP methyl ester carboxylesterase
MELRTAVLHGRHVSYAAAGAGPVLLLIHGMGGGYENWREVIEPLARRYTVIAPDLPGHGASGPTNGDYSVGALAVGLRDLLLALGHDRATLVGHSLGGGIAMQLAYQFPELAERLVLVSSGGLGPEVSLVLRAVALPGSELCIAMTARTAGWLGPAVGRGLAAVRFRPSPATAEVARGYVSLSDSVRRSAFLSTLRSVINVGGQRIDASDRLYLTAGIPALIVWGARDPVIPVSHGERAHAAIVGSRLEVFDGVGHIPQLEAPERFVAVLERFLKQTKPARFDARAWRARFQTSADAPQQQSTPR